MSRCFSPKWDEWYGQPEWKAGKLAGPHTRSKVRPHLLQLHVVMRTDSATDDDRSGGDGKRDNKQSRASPWLHDREFEDRES